jgi:hypothetical protein
MQRICGGRYKTQVAGCRLQVGNCAGWNFAGWGFCRLEFCRLPGILQVDNANLKLHHFFSILVWLSCAFIAVWLLVGAFDISLSCCHVPSLCTKASGHHLRENIKMTRLAWTFRGTDGSIVARSLHDVVEVQKMPEWGVSPLHPLMRSPLKPPITVSLLES